METEDGETENYYVKLPDEIGEASMHLPDSPTELLGEELSGTRVTELPEPYYDYLAGLVQGAEEEFG